jgi:hypothetical protein
VARVRRDQVLLPSLLAVLVVVAGVVGVAIWRTRDRGGAGLPALVDASPDPLAQARTAILAAYDGYLRASVEANRRGDPSYDGLPMYIGDLLRAQVSQGIIAHNASGSYYTGDLKSETKVDSIDMDAKPPTATLSACMDATNYQLVYRKDNSPVPGTNAGRRYMAAATATMNQDGRWLITAAVARTDQPC